MTSTLLDGARRPATHDPGQDALFDDLRRAEPGTDPGGRAEPAAREPGSERGERGPRSGGDRLMLEDLLERTWEGLLAAGAAECPLCEGRLELFDDRGECGTCGAVLA